MHSAAFPGARAPPPTYFFPRAAGDDALPMMLNGQPVGIQLENISPDNILSDIGLKNNDILTAVNNEKIIDPEQVITFLENIKKGGQFAVNVVIRSKGRIPTRLVLLSIK